MTIRDASYLILLLVLNGDSGISLDFEIGIDCFLFLFFAVSMLFTTKKPGFIPEPTARSAVPGVSPWRGSLIPHGYLHPGKSKHSEA